MSVKYPNITVKLIGQDGNAFAILGSVRKALRQNGVPPEEINKFIEDAMSGSYDELLSLVVQTVNVSDI